MAEFTPITTQEQFDTAIAQRISRAQETERKKFEGYLSPEDARKKYEGYLSPEQAAEKYKGYLTPAQAAEKDARIKGYETNSVKMRIAHEAGIPFELVDRLSGDDEAAIRKDAETLAGFLKSNNPAAPLADPEGGSNSKDAALRNLAATLTK